MNNPFLSSSMLNLPLRLDLCQEIHYSALSLAATSNLYLETAPDPTFLKEIINRRSFQGADAFLVHPAYIEQIFAGFTSDVYRTIEDLYCSRLKRSIKITCLLLNKMAEEAGVSPLDYEAVWAVCMFLEERRQGSTEVIV